MYLFIFGRNPILSKLEVLRYFSERGIMPRIISSGDSYYHLDFQGEDIDENQTVKELGGTVRIAKVFHRTTNLEDDFLEEMFFEYPKSYNYAISSINVSKDSIENIELYLKYKNKQYNSKGVLKRTYNSIVEPSKYWSWKLNEGLEIIVLDTDSEYILAQGIASTNPKDYEFKDTNRPETKFTHSTSFRLAQIMVNILGLSKGDTVVDPFCGTGTFLIEAMLKGINAVGVENDRELVDIARQNINWARKTFEISKLTSSQIIEDDSQNAAFAANGVVFEPYMGPFIKNSLSPAEAGKIIKELEDLYTNVFSNLAKSTSPGANIVCVIPAIPNKSRMIDISTSVFEKDWEAISLKNIYGDFDLKNPINYNTPDGSKIGRRIYLLQKRS